MLDVHATPSAIVRALDEYVIGQDEAKRIVAVAVYAHFRKVERSREGGAPIVKSNVLLIGPSGTGKTLMCETLAKALDVPFATAEATSIAQARFVNDEIDAILERLIDRAGGDVRLAERGIVFIDEIDKLKAPAGQPRSVSGESVQHALLKIMEGAQVKLGNGRYLDTTHVLFICGGAFVGLDEIRSVSHNYGFIATMRGENQRILDRLNGRVKPTDLFTFGLIPEFTGRLPIIARFAELDRDKLVRIMTEPRDSILAQFRDIFANEGVDLVVERRVFEQIADLALEYQTGARSLRGLFEELLTPVLYLVPDDPGIERVEIESLFAEPRLVRREAGVAPAAPAPR
jgi:ATP-dependent Clp protease ATP-binding subunit ClpX